MQLPHARGPVSTAVVEALRAGTDLPPRAGAALPTPSGAMADADLQLALWVLYALHYRGFDEVPAEREWDLGLLALRQQLEQRFEDGIRELVAEPTTAVADDTGTVSDEIRALIDAAPASDLARFLQREADVEQFREQMVQRSVYTRRESDPSAWLLPRLDGPPKVALAELLYDEYGAGLPGRLHATLFARALEDCDLDPSYGAHVDRATAQTLAVDNATTMFGLHRRLRGAGLGFLAAFEATSSLACRRISAAAERLGLPATVAEYFDEHVEADAVHEQVALGGICDAAVALEPELRADVRLGAAAYLWLEAAAGRTLTETWASRPDEAVSA